MSATIKVALTTHQERAPLYSLVDGLGCCFTCQRAKTQQGTPPYRHSAPALFPAQTAAALTLFCSSCLCDTVAAASACVITAAAEGQAAARRTALLARCSPLTPDLAAAAASHGTLLLVAADWGMFELFGVNWLTHVQRSGVDNYLLAALDQVG
jgi:hypothetical protein